MTMKRKIGTWDCAKELLEALPGGLLLTAGGGGRANPMTIGWGTLGIEWGTPIFIAFVRQNRFTRQLLEKNPEFTVSAPYGQSAKEILALCGLVERSGQGTNLIFELSIKEAKQLPDFTGTDENFVSITLNSLVYLTRA